MNPEIIGKAIQLISPGSEIVIVNDDITWHKIIGEKPTDEQIQAKIAEVIAAEPMRRLRIKRTIILAESDWMANSDVTMSDAWRDYRQALRDLPANSPNVALDEQGNLINVTWPTKPE